MSLLPVPYPGYVTVEPDPLEPDPLRFDELKPMRLEFADPRFPPRLSNRAIDRLCALLREIKIGEPIASAFSPRLEIVCGLSEVLPALEITISTLDAFGSGRHITVTFRDTIHPTFLASFFYGEDGAKLFAQWVFDRLASVIKHELQEATTFREQYIEHPHPHG